MTCRSPLPRTLRRGDLVGRPYTSRPGQRPSYVSPPPLDPFGGAARCNLEPKRVLVIASGEEWPYGATTPLRELSHPTSINNIEGRGIGFFAGVQPHVFPFAGCIPLERSSPCTITFSPRSATLVGMVTNGCTGGTMDDVRVRLLGPLANGIRYDTTDVSGVFQLQGLEPDAAHSLELTQLVAVGLGDFFPAEVESVAVAEAAVDTIAIEMTHRLNCLP